VLGTRLVFRPRPRPRLRPRPTKDEDEDEEKIWEGRKTKDEKQRRAFLSSLDYIFWAIE
jgi:hypothetical protein